MPTYDYQCRNCGQITEVVHSMTEEGPSVCERCGGPLRRVLYPAGIIFKGSGFYSTDSRASGSGARRTGAAGRGSSGSDGASEGATGTPAPSGESKDKPKETGRAADGPPGSKGASSPAS